MEELRTEVRTLKETVHHACRAMEVLYGQIQRIATTSRPCGDPYINNFEIKH